MESFRRRHFQIGSMVFAIFLILSFAGVFSLVRAAGGGAFDGIDLAERQWLESYNAGGQVGAGYMGKALLFSGKEDLICGSSEIEGYYHQAFAKTGKVTGMRTIARYEAAPQVVYEISEYTLAKGGFLRTMVVWSNRDGSWVREIEASVGAADPAGDTAEIDAARIRYEELCAENDVEHFLKSIYQPQAVYYSKGALYKGFPNIGVAYNYFNIPGYEIKLTLLSEIRASANTAYEIGEYRTVNGRAKGLYIMIWQRDEAGDWRVLLDSNV